MARRKKSNKLNYWLYAAGIFRITLILIPQTGYVHPDEYFQSVEVLAGGLFDVHHSPPWEFNTTQPIRGITIPYFTTGMCYIFLRDINNLAMEYLSLNFGTPYFLTILPRLLIGIFSFIVDFSLYKICLTNNEKYKTRLLILSSSYVMLIYGTRTFSNTIELILFAVLLYFVCESQTFSNELLRKQEYIKYRYEKSTSVVERAKFHKLKLYLVSDTYRNCLLIATLTVFGIFSRPTFIGFAVVPVFFWIYRGAGNKQVSVAQFHTRILFFAICCVPAILFNVLIDSFYYGHITWGEIAMLDVSINNFVVTPLNFLRYNTDSTNLAKHGLHPRYLHLLINIPLLFNVLGILALYTFGQYIYLGFQRKFNLLPSIRSIKMLMTMSFISPVLILSFFPHQEPRFLIPIILPLVYLHGGKILPETDTILVKVPETSIQEKRKEIKVNKSSYQLFKLWLILNLLLLIFYGFIHQGGVYQATNYLYKDIKLTSLNTEFHIVTSNIYSLPESFFLEKSSNKVYTNDKIFYSFKKRVFLYEEGSKDLLLLVTQLKSMVEAKEMLKSNLKHSKNYKVYLLISSSRSEQVTKILQEHDVFVHKLDSFWPHLSTEAFPDFTSFCFNPTFIFYKNCKVLPFLEYVQKINEMCELSLYELDYMIEKSIVAKDM